MLDARIVATNTNDLALDAKFWTGRTDWIVASAHGPALELIMNRILPHRRSHLRFTPKNGHDSDIAPCPLSAKSGLMQCSNEDRYSITSSMFFWGTYRLLIARIGRLLILH